jgi:GMP synthase (glutamine-hydrolysing)
VVGEIRPDKLGTVKKATAIAERELAQHKPGQYFAVIMDNEEAPKQNGAVHVQETVARLLNTPSRNVHATIFKDKATGVKAGERRYGNVVGIKVETLNGKIHQPEIQSLVSLQAKITTEHPEITRVFYAVKDLPEKKPYVTSIRAVQTKDFLTAQISEIPWTTLNRIAEETIEQCPSVSTVYYDVTPKPPATIEME